MRRWGLELFEKTDITTVSVFSFSIQFVSEKKCEDAEIQEIARAPLSIKKKSKKKTEAKADGPEETA